MIETNLQLSVVEIVAINLANGIYLQENNMPKFYNSVDHHHLITSFASLSVLQHSYNHCFEPTLAGNGQF